MTVLAQAATGDLLSGVAEILWVLVAAFVAIRLIPAIVGVIDKRNVEVEIGGMKISLQRVVEQVQAQIGQLTAAVSEVAPAESGRASETKTASPSGDRRVLWVDDNPTNNASYIQQLTAAGIDVQLATSTGEGMEVARREKFTVVISDMHRTESGRSVDDAGIQLARRLRELPDPPRVIFFTSADAAAAWRERALVAGASGITASPLRLFALLQEHGVSFKL